MCIFTSFTLLEVLLILESKERRENDRQSPVTYSGCEMAVDKNKENNDDGDEEEKVN